MEDKLELCINIQRRYSELLSIISKFRRQVLALPFKELYSLIHGFKRGTPVLIVIPLLTLAIVSELAASAWVYTTIPVYTSLSLLLLLLYIILQASPKAYYASLVSLSKTYGKLLKTKKFYETALKQCSNR